MIKDSQKFLLLTLLVLVCFLIYLLSPILSPFLVAATLAYMGDPIVDKLEKWKFSRTGAVVVSFGSLLLVLSLSVLLLVPMLANQFKVLAEFGPVALERIGTDVLPWVEANFGVDVGSLNWFDLRTSVDWSQTGSLVSQSLKQVTQSSIAILAVLANLVLIPVVTFYLLRDWDVLVEKVGSLIPRQYFDKTRSLTLECHEVLGAFIRGQLLVMLALAIIYSTGLMIIGVELGLLIGIVAGLASIVPYMGTIVGIGAALIAAFFQFQDWLPLIWVALVFGIGQMIEGMVLTPLLVGDRIGLHPVAVIFAVLAGGQLFGFVGILIALPVAAVIMVLLRHIHDNYKGSLLYGHKKEVMDSQDPQ